MIYLNPFLRYTTNYTVKRILHEHHLLHITNSIPSRFLLFEYSHQSQDSIDIQWDWSISTDIIPVYAISVNHQLDGRSISQNSFAPSSSKLSGILHTIYNLSQTQTRQWYFHTIKPIESWYIDSICLKLTYVPSVIPSSSFTIHIPIHWLNEQGLDSIRYNHICVKCCFYTSDVDSLSFYLKSFGVDEIQKQVDYVVFTYYMKEEQQYNFNFEIDDKYLFMINRMKVEFELYWCVDKPIVKNPMVENVVSTNIHQPIQRFVKFKQSDTFHQLSLIEDKPLFTWILYIRNIPIDRNIFYRCLLSLVQQEYQQWEIIICDDGLPIPLLYDFPWIQQFFGERLRILSHPLGDYKGISYWLNRSIQHVKTDYVIFILDWIVYSPVFLSSFIMNQGKGNSFNHYCPVDENVYCLTQKQTPILRLEEIRYKELFKKEYDDCMVPYFYEYIFGDIVDGAYCFELSLDERRVRNVKLDFIGYAVEKVRWEWSLDKFGENNEIYLDNCWGLLKYYNGVEWFNMRCNELRVRDWWMREGSKVRSMGREIDCYLDWRSGWFPSLEEKPVLKYLFQNKVYHPYFVLDQIVILGSNKKNGFNWDIPVLNMLSYKKMSGRTLYIRDCIDYGKLVSIDFWGRLFSFIPSDWRVIILDCEECEGHQLWKEREWRGDEGCFLVREEGERTYEWRERIVRLE